MDDMHDTETDTGFRPYPFIIFYLSADTWTLQDFASVG